MALTLGGSLLIPSGRRATTISATSPVSRTTTGQSAVKQSGAEYYHIRPQSTSEFPSNSRSHALQSPIRQGPVRSKTASSLLTPTMTNGTTTPLTSSSRPFTPMPSRPVSSFTPLSPKASTTPQVPTAVGSTVIPITTKVVAANTISAPTIASRCKPTQGIGQPMQIGSFVAPVSAKPAFASLTVPFLSLPTPEPQVPISPIANGSAVAVAAKAYLPTSGGSFTVPAANGSLTIPPVQLMKYEQVVPLGSASTVSLEAQQPQLLQAGTTLQIQGSLYCVTEPLGMGSFGAVWAAERVDGVPGEVAIKEIACYSKKELGDAALEGKLLRMIHSSRPQQLIDKAPNLVGTETLAIGPDQWVMRLAMTKVPGIQLDTFLDMCRYPQAIGNNAAIAAAAGVVATQSQTLAGVCKFARDMLSQLAFIFECMSPVVYHRDVSPHNILIDTMNSSGFKFGLVDFGLGSDFQSWHGPQGSGSWHHADIGGDCRYWPISVWVMFVSGADELMRTPALAKEYQARLDFHAVGITVLEVVMTLLPQSALAREDMSALKAAWDQYWQDVTRFWKRTMEVFDSGQDPTALKLWIRGAGRVYDILESDLSALRAALRRAGQTCLSSCPDAALVFTTLLELVSNGGMSGVNEGLQSPSWLKIRGMIDGDSSFTKQPRGGSLLVAAGSTAPNYGGSMLVSMGGYAGSLVVPAGIMSNQGGSTLVPAMSPMLSSQSGSTMVPTGSGKRDVSRARSPVYMPYRSPIAMHSPTRAVRA